MSNSYKCTISRLLYYNVLMKTLIEEFKCKDRWYPIPIFDYKNSLTIESTDDFNERIRCNFAYNMQYIEFLEKEFDELKLSSVLEKMLYKTYIITVMSIIECLFSYLLKASGNWKSNSWKEISTLQTKETTIENVVYKIKNIIYRKTDDTNFDSMNLDAMIKKVETKNLLKNVNHKIFPVLKNLRQLRNRIHLHIGEQHYDNDYNNFSYDEVKIARQILYKIVTNDTLCKKVTVYDFLKQKIS